jgi:hypothetical protein
MPVVINEFEVVDTPPAVPAATATASAQAAPRRMPDEEDLRRLVAEMAERALRVWSH